MIFDIRYVVVNAGGTPWINKAITFIV